MNILIKKGVKRPCDIKLGENSSQICIGDVHGYYAPLRLLFDSMQADYPSADSTFLGDLVDRGPESAKCLSWAISKSIESALDSDKPSVTYIPGNHEQMLLGTVFPQPEFREMSENFFRNGGKWLLPVIGSQDDESGLSGGENLTSWLDTLIQDLSPDCSDYLKRSGLSAFEWLSKRDVYRRVGNVLMVHGGVAPQVNGSLRDWLESQKLIAHDYSDMAECDALWIRDAFLKHDGPFPDNVFVIHGHSIDTDHRNRGPDKGGLYPHRLCLDGGSYALGVIVGAYLEEGAVTLWHAIFDPRDPN